MRLVLALFVLAIAPLRAWDAGGHEIVAAIAYANLNPKARAAVDQLIQQLKGPRGSYDNLTVANWMDDVRDDPATPEDLKLRSWHYIDFSLDPHDPTPPLFPGSDTPQHGNAVQALKRALVVLQGGSDPYIHDLPTALAITEHLVGDIHQPLHCATQFFIAHGARNDDRGGNLERVLNGPGDEPKFNLHFFWDDAYRATFDDATGRIVLDPSFSLKGPIDPKAVHAIADLRHSTLYGDPTAFAAWAIESNRFARDFVYPGITISEDHKSCRLGSAYVKQAHDLALSRLSAAGSRLALLLNATLGK